MSPLKSIGLILALFGVQACIEGDSCPAGQQLDPGGGGCIVIGSSVTEDAAPEDSAADTVESLEAAVPTSTIFITVDDKAPGFSLEELTGSTSPVSEVSAAVIGARFVVFEVAQRCDGIAPVTTVVSPGPVPVFPGQSFDGDALLAMQLPAGEFICAGGMYWAAGHGGLASFELSGVFDDGSKFDLRSELGGLGPRLLETEIQVNEGLDIQLSFEPTEWLADLDPTMLDVANDGVIDLSSSGSSVNRDALDRIEFRMQRHSFMEVYEP